VKLVQSGPEFGERFGKPEDDAGNLFTLPGELNARLDEFIDVQRRERSHRM
jgi:hypothetical protein